MEHSPTVRNTLLQVRALLGSALNKSIGDRDFVTAQAVLELLAELSDLVE